MYQFQTQSEGVHIKLQRGRYTPLIASVTIYVALAALSYVFVGDRSPRPLSPLTTVVDWASWYSVIVAFPILTALSTLPFVGNRSAYIIVPVALITPTYLVLYSFFLVYGLPPLGLLLFVIPLAALVPAFIILSVYAVPLIMALTASANVERSEVGMRRMPSWFYFTIIGVAVGLTIIDIVSRYLALGKDPSSLISVVSDVGWAAQVGARDLIHGINPYAAKLPPWGGPAPLSYGPMEFVLLAPFAPLSIDAGAHVASFFYAFLTALGVFMTVRLYRKDLALPAVAFFVALPVTYYVIEAAFTQHIIAAALLAWTVYFYLSGRTRLSGLFMGLAGLTIGIPFALVIPFFFGAGKSERLRLLEGYVPVVLALAGGVFLMFGNHALSSINAFTGVINFYGLSQYLTAYANSILKWIPTAAIFVWFVAASVKVRAREEAVKVSAIFTLLLPFAVGYFYPFFFIWQGLLLIIYMFMRMEVGEPWKSTYSAGSQ